MIHKILHKKICNKLAIIACISCSLCVSTVNAFQIENEGWTFSLNGNVNAGYIYTGCDSSGDAVSGAFLCTGDQDPSAITNGYLPTIFDFGVSTRQGNFDISAHASFDRGLDTNEAFNGSGGGEEGFRIWLTLENDKIGKIHAGRDFGIFASDVIYADMSLISVGANLLTNNPLNTTLGAAGTGYLFVDRLTGLTWTLPTSEALVAQIGLFQPLNLSSFSSALSLSGSETGSEEPGFHGRLRYNFGDHYISTSALTQSVDVVAGGGTPKASYRAYAVDVTGQFNVNNFSFTGSYFMGDGIGQTGFLIDAVDLTGEERESDGYFFQGTYKAGDTKFGLNYGVSTLDDNAADAGTSLIDEKEKITAGVYHNLTKSIILTGEYSYVSAESHAGGDVDNDVLNAGVMFLF